MRVLIATFNRGKLDEYRLLLDGLGLELTSLSEAGISAEVEETGCSFQANALLKARGYSAISGLWTLADDSGLEVDALDGAPGVYSARYSGPRATDQSNLQLLLQQIISVPQELRTARFRCVIALVAPPGLAWTADGTCEGLIARDPRGEHGFGYDPIFYLPELGRTMAELPPALKNRISHRAAAARRFRALYHSTMESIEGG